jgi:hypothetical protein
MAADTSLGFSNFVVIISLASANRLGLVGRVRSNVTAASLGAVASVTADVTCSPLCEASSCLAYGSHCSHSADRSNMRRGLTKKYESGDSNSRGQRRLVTLQ